MFGDILYWGDLTAVQHAVQFNVTLGPPECNAYIRGLAYSV